jgi:hypothetical protein
VETSATGTYTVTGLGSESYEVEFFAPSGNYLTQFYNGASSLHSATAVAVTAGATKSPINAEMAAAYGSLSGTVTNASSHAALEHVEIEVYDSDGTYVAAGETAANGTYTIAGLAPGEYEVQFLPSTGAYLKQYYKGKSSLGEATAVIVTPGSTTAAVNAELVVGGEISGTVTDAVTQAGLEHVEVKVYDSSDAYLARAETASNGEYTVSGLAPGSYEVGFADGAGYAPQFYSGKAFISEATKVRSSRAEASPGQSPKPRPRIRWRKSKSTSVTRAGRSSRAKKPPPKEPTRSRRCRRAAIPWNSSPRPGSTSCSTTRTPPRLPARPRWLSPRGTPAGKSTRRWCSRRRR